MAIYYKKASIFFFCGLITIFLTSAAGGQNMFRKVNDFDGDGKADFAVTRNENGYKIWYVWQSRDGFRVLHWGLGGSSDFNAPGDSAATGKPTLRSGAAGRRAFTGCMAVKPGSSPCPGELRAIR